MAIKYCDWINGNDTTGDGSYGTPYKTIDKSVLGMTGQNEVRCAKSPDPVQLSGTLNFTYGSVVVPTSEDLTGVFDSKKLSQRILCNFNGADQAVTHVTDSFSTVTFSGNAKIVTAEKPFGSSSLYLDGTGDYVSIPDENDLYFSVNNGFQQQEEWTIDVWIKSGNNAGTQAICGQYYDGNNYWSLQFVSGKLRFYYYCGATWRAYYDTTNVVLSDITTWHRVTVVRSGAAFRIFWDGVSQALTVSTACAAFNCDDISSPWYIGCGHSAGSNCFNGWIKSFRWHKGWAKSLVDFNPSETEPVWSDPMFVGKGSDEYWHEVAYSTPTQLVLYRKYGGTTETGKNGYYLRYTSTGTLSADINVQSIPEASKGTSDLLRITISGGWDLSTQTQTGWTNFFNAGHRSRGTGIYHLASSSDSANPNYVEFSKFRCIKYYYNMRIRNGSNIKLTDMTFLEAGYSNFSVDRYFVNGCQWNRVYAIGSWWSGFYFSQSTNTNFFKELVAIGGNTYGLYIDSSSQSSQIYKDCKFNLNKSINFYDRSTSYSQTSWIDCEFNDSLFSTGWYADQNGGTYASFSGCKFNRNYGDGFYNQNVSCFAVGCQFNNNITSRGASLYMATFIAEGCEFNNNALEGVYKNENNGYRAVSFKHCTAINNVCGRDIYFVTNTHNPSDEGYITTHLPPEYWAERYAQWIVEDLTVGVWRVDFQSGYGITNFQMQTLGTDWRWTYYGIVGKHTGSEARGGSGSCMYIQPVTRYTSYYDQPAVAALYKEWQGAVNGAELTFAVADVATDKRLKVWIKRTSDFSMGTVKLAVIANGKVFITAPLDVTTDYQEFYIDIDKNYVKAGNLYTLRVLASAKNEAWNTGRVYVDDFSVESI
jgi:hypothetical protein